MKQFLLNLKQFYCLIALTLLGNFLSAQNISGKVTDSLNNPIVYANVIIKDSLNKHIVKFTTTDLEGKYQISLKKPGNYIISFSALLYKTEAKILSLKNENIVIDIVLTEQVTALNEVIVQTDRPIVVKKDTITYTVSAFLKGNEITVEDLLKNLPGINVDNDGTIRIGNQEVEKIMVEGDDFFKKGYKLLTKNLNSEVVSKVEIYQKYSNNKLLKGIEDSGKVAINLILKEDRKIDWFGNLHLSYGLISENRYKVRGNMMRFGKKTKHFFLANLNNVGEDSGGESAIYLTASDLNDVGTVGDGQQANSLIYLEGFGLSLKRRRFNFNNSELVSLNSIFKLNEKAKLKTNTLFNWDENSFNQNSIQDFKTGNISFTNTESTQLEKRNFRALIELDFDYDISNTQLLEYDGSYTNGFMETSNNLTFNTVPINEYLNATNDRIEQKIVYSNKFKANKVFALSASHIYERKPQNYAIDTYLYDNLFDVPDIINVKQFSGNEMNFIGFEAQLLDRKPNDNLLDIKTGFSFRNDGLNSNLNLNESIGDLKPNGFQNQLNYKVGDIYTNIKYKLVLGDYSLVPKLEIHQIFNRFESYLNTESQNLFFINPAVSINYKINENNNLALNYNRNITNTDLVQVFDNYILTNYRGFSKGLGNPDQIASSSISLNYSLGKWTSSFFANATVSYVKNHDFFSTDITVTPNYSLSQIEILNDDSEIIIANLKMDQYISFISNNLKFEFQYLNNNFKNSVNNQELRLVKNQSYQFGLELRSAFEGILNYHLGTKWNVNKIETTSSFKNFYNTSFMDINFGFSKALNAEIQTERYHFDNLATNNAYYFLDMEGKYKWEKKNLTFTLMAKNVLNVKTFKEVFISDINTSITSYRLLPRFFLLGVDFRF